MFIRLNRINIIMEIISCNKLQIFDATISPQMKAKFFLNFHFEWLIILTATFLKIIFHKFL